MIRLHRPPLPWLAAIGLAFLALTTFPSQAASTDIATVPLFTSSSVNVKPNLMFILDDSGSMSRAYMPDDANFSSSKYGGSAAQCNGLAYNPNVTYSPPINAAGVTASAGSLSIFTVGDPNNMLSQTTVTSPTSLSIPASVGGSQSVTVSSSAVGLYTVGQTVTLFSTGSTSKYISGTVSSWTVAGASGTLVFTINAKGGSGTLSSTLKVAPGTPASSQYYYRYTGTEKALGYTYTSAGVITSTNFFLECNSTVGSSPGAAVFSRVDVTSASADAQNYANWRAYYSTRMLMAKSSLSLVFQSLDSRYRVGYTTISDTTVTESSTFLNIRDFDATQKSDFFNAFNAATPGSTTPLRGALSKAGRYYAKKYPGQTYDPVQYACQKNFTLLSTDGYWNIDAETSTYGPFGLNGGLVGNLDGVNAYPSARPKYDGGNTTVTNRTTWSTTRTTVSQGATTTITYPNAKVTTTGSYSFSSGSVATSYSGAITNGSFSISNCNSSARTCTVTVSASNNNLAVGTAITVLPTSGNAGFRGSFTVTASNSSNFSYVATFSSVSPTLPTTPSSGSRGYTFLQSAGGTTCPSGQGVVTATNTQTDTYSLAKTLTTTADVTTTISYTQTQSVLTTPYTQTVVYVNGAFSSDTGPVAGTSTTTNTALTPPASNVSVATGQTVSSAPASGSTTVTASPTLSYSCVTSRPSNYSTGSTSSTTTQVTATPSFATTVAATTRAQSVSGPVNSQLSDSGVVTGASSTTSTSVSSGGSSNSLADVAFYYFNNDLRDQALWNNCTGALGNDVCGTNESFPKQNMLTMTLGLGASGLLAYDKNYLSQKSAGSGDYYAIKSGSKNWPIPIAANAGGEGPENIDDLWHAAINGTDFGTVSLPVTSPNTQYFSAGDPRTLIDSLSVALSNVTAVLGSSSAAATSTLQPVTGDNDVFVAKFTSVQWTGDVQRLSINPNTGVLSTTATWSAATQLDNRDLVANPRRVLYARPNTSTLVDFSYANLAADGLNTYFDNFCSKPGSGGNSAPTQCALMVSKTAANTGSNLVNYLLGANDDNYRARSSRLGDVINGAPLFVGIPKFKYADAGYTSFASSTRQGYCASGSTAGSSTRQGTVYVGANDGMLHAFDRCDGSEKWAYIPRPVMPNLYALADNSFSTNHQFYVDGAPVSGDIWDGTQWKTILVGGLNGGGKGYYALDITDPATPKSLWEFTIADYANLGLTYGNPVITKRATDGKWVVVFGSGYNNTSGDGNGHLLMLDANTGALIMDVPTLLGGTAVGTAASPSGLAKINAWVETETDNTALRYYGGDLLGNVWRFDTEDLMAPKKASFRLTQLIKNGKIQPITTQPELAQVTYHGANYAVIYIGTGRYLGMSDLGNTDPQTIYAIKDDLSAVTLGDVRLSNTLVGQTLSTNGSVRTATSNPVDWGTKNGWYVDLPSTGERINVSMLLAFNVLSVASTVPSVSACDSGGTSWLYKLDIGTGSAVSNAADNAAGLLLQQGTLIVGQTVVQLTNGDATTISTLSDGNLRSDSEKAPSMDSVMHRTSWRELAN